MGTDSRADPVNRVPALHNSEDLKFNIIAEKDHSPVVGPFHERFSGIFMLLCTCYLYADNCASDFAIRILDGHKSTVN